MKYMRRLLAVFLTIAMVFTTAVPVPVQAASLEESQQEKDILEAIGTESQSIEKDNLNRKTENERADEYITIQSMATKKYVKTYNDAATPVTVDGEENDPDILFKEQLVPYEYNGLTWGIVSNAYDKCLDAGQQEFVRMHGNNSPGGWESIRVFPNGDGTVSFKDPNRNRYISLDNDTKQMISNPIPTETTLTDSEKFIIQGKVPIKNAVSGLTMTESTLDSISLSWEKVEPSFDDPFIYTNNIIYWKKSGESTYTNKKNVGIDTSCQIRGLDIGSYDFKIVTVNGQGDPLNDDIASDGIELENCVTKQYKVPDTPGDLEMSWSGGTNLRLTWKASNRATYYVIQHGRSRFDAEFEDMTTTDNRKSADGRKKAGKLVATTNTYIDLTTSTNPYEDYYRVVAVNGGTPDNPVEDEERSIGSDGIGPEMDLFGRHTIIFSPHDETKKIDELLQEIFDDANDYDADAQFKGEQWQIYFKPGDYTETSCMYLGFYTSFNGLGKTPYDVKLNNIAIPAYLPNGALGGNGDNATCNFWRSAENLSIIDTGNEQGRAGYDSYRPEYLNWAVAQAAPLRRIYSERPVAEDWNFGWASGGYVADCYFAGVADGNSGGTFSGQQFYTRNTKMLGNAYGTTLNNFFQGVEAPNLSAGDKGDPLLSNEGYSTWDLAADDGGQRVFTSITNTEKISEKPFLYLNDDGEYEIFVPDVRKNTKGISWSKKSMGIGESLPLDEFYIAKPSDSASVINGWLAAGKNIYFTPGIYHAETPIRVTRPNTILLGTGMTSIIPDNDDVAMEVADVDGVRIEGLIFDAGAHSEYLLKVGEPGKHVSHSNNPIILQDLFFRVGGTTDVLTKADNALEINSDDVIGDHFWIWRADHGAGVEWFGNESKHGLIVNGDNVTCYALFNEHFQSYHTLWNGENGKTYFYQNETCYDPISQEAWMSHKGTVNGYASYKVANKVNKHYAVGLGVYNVFIYTGPTYDSSEVKIQLDNAIEVPNKPGVLVENACVQTFANDDSQLQKINSIVNGAGYGVSSGRRDEFTFEKGEGWSRKFLLFYRNGRALYGKMPEGDEKNKYIGTESRTDIPQPMNDEGDVDLSELQKIYSSLKEEAFYTSESWKSSGIVVAKEEARVQLEEKGEDWAVQEEVDVACQNLMKAIERLVPSSEPGTTAQPDTTAQPEETAQPGETARPGTTVQPSTTPQPSPTVQTVSAPQQFASVGTGTNSLKLTWKKDKNIDKYRLVLYDKKGKKIKTVNTTKASYKFAKLSKLTTYQVGIYAIKMDGKTELLSKQVKIKTSTSPAKVTLSTVKKSSNQKVKVTWKKVKGASGYEIYIKSGTGKYKKAATITKGKTVSYTLSKLKKKTSYKIRVKAYIKVGNGRAYGAYSKAKSVKM